MRVLFLYTYVLVSRLGTLTPAAAVPWRALLSRNRSLRELWLGSWGCSCDFGSSHCWPRQGKVICGPGQEQPKSLQASGWELHQRRGEVCHPPSCLCRGSRHLCGTERVERGPELLTDGPFPCVRVLCGAPVCRVRARARCCQSFWSSRGRKAAKGNTGLSKDRQKWQGVAARKLLAD